MKTVIILLIIFYATIVNCQTERAIEVMGNSEIMVTPDNLIWSISISKEGNSAQSLKKDIDRSTNGVLNILKREGILDADIQTSGITINKIYYQDKGRPEFSASNMITVKLSNIDLYSKLSDEIIEIENVYPNSPSLRYSKEIETRERSREEALLAAKNKAIKMAEVLQVKLGRIMKIEELLNPYYPNPFNSSSIIGIDQRESGVFKEGQIRVTASVKVVFELTD